MSSPGRPARAVLALLAVIVLGLGVGAYFVNVPVLWIAVVEVLALIALAFQAMRFRQPQPVTSEPPDSESKT